MTREEQYNFFLNMTKVLMYIDETKLNDNQIHEVREIKKEICSIIDVLINSTDKIDIKIIDDIKEEIHNYLKYVHEEYYY